MYRRNYRKRIKPAILLASLVVLLTVTVVGTFAYISTQTAELENVFQMAKVPNMVVEDITTDPSVKKDVKIQNIDSNGSYADNVDAYIRAEVVFNWIGHNGVIYGQSLAEGTDYTIDWKLDGWKKGSDGYFYYTQKVAPGAMTNVLFTDCKAAAGKAPYDFELGVTIVAQSIQADGKDASGKAVVETVWPVTVNADGTLTVK